jgi:tRNA-splicing ligase RtcB
MWKKVRSSRLRTLRSCLASKHSIALPDMHFGYGFPIGGVAALDFERGGLSPGGIGFDINCGVRMLRTNFEAGYIVPKLQKILDAIFKNVPSGLGSKGKVRLAQQQLKTLLENGAKWTVDNGYGTEKDIQHLEEGGCLKGADASKVSEKALKRGMPQVGSLGAGNHFLELQRVEKIFMPEVAKAFGIEREGQVTIMIHTGSRGFGHQVCTDYLQILENAFRDRIRELPDRELVYAPAGTRECNDYFAAMACAANFAWANRHMIMHWVRESIYKTLGVSEADAGIDVVYDVAHNIGKIEEHVIDGKRTKVYIHRKGATRALGPNATDLPSDYKSVGQPVLVPGSMGTASYVLVGTKQAEEETFSSVVHGAGRMQSRTKARRTYRGEAVKKSLGDKGVLVRSASWKVLAEEAPGVYKDVDEVVRVCEVAGITKTVAKLKPLGVVKG